MTTNRFVGGIPLTTPPSPPSAPPAPPAPTHVGGFPRHAHTGTPGLSRPAPARIEAPFNHLGATFAGIPASTIDALSRGN
jgi:hypothetical protein